MFRIFFILLLSPLLTTSSITPSDGECPANELLPRLCSLWNEIVFKLEKGTGVSNKSQKQGPLPMDEIITRLINQTEYLNKLKAEFKINSYSNGNNNKPNSESLYQQLGRTRIIKSEAPSSCSATAIQTQTTGLYTIQVDTFSSRPFLVYCNETMEEGVWTVIQRCVDYKITFYRDWNSYKIRFGNLVGNFFIGFNRLYAMTSENQKSLIILRYFEDIKMTAKYDSFAIGNENENCNLKELGQFTGHIRDSLSFYRGMNFSTKDRNTNTMAKRNCPHEFKRGLVG